MDAILSQSIRKEKIIQVPKYVYPKVITKNFSVNKRCGIPNMPSGYTPVPNDKIYTNLTVISYDIGFSPRYINILVHHGSIKANYYYYSCIPDNNEAWKRSYNANSNVPFDIQLTSGKFFTPYLVCPDNDYYDDQCKFSMECSGNHFTCKGMALRNTSTYKWHDWKDVYSINEYSVLFNFNIDVTFYE